VGGENTHDESDCVTLVPSFRGFAILALSSCVSRQPHLLHPRTVLRNICEQDSPFSLLILNQVSDVISTGIHILIPHPPASSGASRTPDRLFLFPCQHPKHEHLFAAVPYTPSALHDNHQRDQRTNTIHFALTRAGPRLYHPRSTNTRQPLPLFRANPTTHVARVRTRLRPPISQTSHLPPIVFAAAVSTIDTLPRVRVHVSIARRRNAFAGRRRRRRDGLDADGVSCARAGLTWPFVPTEGNGRDDGPGDVVRACEYCRLVRTKEYWCVFPSQAKGRGDKEYADVVMGLGIRILTSSLGWCAVLPSSIILMQAKPFFQLIIE